MALVGSKSEQLAVERTARKFDLSGVPWSLDRAKSFNAFAAGSLGQSPVPVKLRRGRVTFIGQHVIGERITLADMYFQCFDDPERWRVLIHEISHYRVQDHTPKFNAEQKLVYRMWLRWVKENS